MRICEATPFGSQGMRIGSCGLPAVESGLCFFFLLGGRHDQEITLFLKKKGKRWEMGLERRANSKQASGTVTFCHFFFFFSDKYHYFV